MKEFEQRAFILSKGLRRFKSRRNSDELDECYNLAPMENGLEPHEAVALIGSETRGFLMLDDTDFLITEGGDKIII